MNATAHPEQPNQATGRITRLLLAALLGSGPALASAGTLGVFTSDAKGFDTHTFYYDDGKEVVLIDTQFVPALTGAMLEQIKRETRSPVTTVIVTHPNPDKFNGLATLHALGIHSISSKAVAEAMPAVHRYKENFWVNQMKAFPAGSYPRFEPVQESFSGTRTLKLQSGETLTLIPLQHSGVATAQLAVRIDASGDLLVGDLVHHKAHAWLEGGLVDGKPSPDLAEWSAALDELPLLAKGHPEARVYGGRGEFVAVAEAVKAQKAYLAGARRITESYLASLSRPAAELGRPEQAARHYASLEQRFSEAFPDYALPYMVRYSVYGLAQSLAAGIPDQAQTAQR